MNLIPIPAGRFTMGSPASERGSQEDEVLHKVDLTQDFHMGTTEVTEHQWAMVMEEPFRTEVVEIRDPETKRLVKKEERQIKNPKLDSQLPVTGISWGKAVEFCKRLGKLPEEKKEGRRYRLPTESEWEYACRAGTSSAFSHGDDVAGLNEFAWHSGNSSNSKTITMPVAQKQANAWGLYDMHGNVAEWCNDYYGDYAEDLVSNPTGPKKLSSPKRVVRGGTIASKASQCRSGWRSQANPASGTTLTGFRVALVNELATGFPSSGLESVVNGIGQRLIKIPEGRFQMGSTTGKSYEKPLHNVVISKSYFIADTEVTQEQWMLIMNTDPWRGKDHVTEGVDYPATYVSWEVAVDYCQRLSAMPEEKAAGRMYRLPTEAEWEYACRSGQTTDFTFGSIEFALDEHAWYTANSNRTPEEVRLKLPNSWGLFDMHGNVAEWCADGFDANAYSLRRKEVKDPFVEMGTERVNRGGSWRVIAGDCRSSRRGVNLPDFRGDSLGFRVCMQSNRKDE